VPILWGYVPDTRPAIQWHRIADGNWTASDRGTAFDTFEAVVTFRGAAAELDDFEHVLRQNRGTISATFTTGEEIFGADVSIAGALSVSVVDYGREEQVGYDIFSRQIRLRLLGSPSFLGSASLATIRAASLSSAQDSQFDISKHFFLDRTGGTHDRATDPGLFEVDISQTLDEMQAIRRYFLTTGRTAAVSMPSFGITYPFGRAAGTGPFTAKITEWKEAGRGDGLNWGARVRFAREF